MSKGSAKRLTPITVNALNTTGNYPDGGQLYLRVRPDGSKSWAFRFKIGGKQHWMSLGPVRDMPLAEAREGARKLRHQLREGFNPLAVRQERKALTLNEQGRTFDAVAALYIEAHGAEWRNPKHRAQWQSTIAAYASPIIGNMPVGSIGLDEVKRVLVPIWKTKPETASRLRGRIEAVLDYAGVHKWRIGDNPARWTGYLDQILPAKAKVAKVVHHAALPWADMPAFMCRLRGAAAVSARCLEFTILTAARSGEARGARWSEIDMQAVLWTVPGDRMKAGKAHRVPLSPRAMEVLTALDAIPHKPDALLFPGGVPGRPLSDVAVSKALRSIQTGLTVHGFRSTFRDWCADQTGFPREIAEAALAHTNKDKVEAAYLRGDALEKRRRLMETWADYCTHPADQSADVVTLRLAG